MIQLHPISRANALVFRSVHLRALMDSPTAFASRYEVESKLADVEWFQRGLWGNGEKSIGYLACDGDDDGDDCCGIAAGYFPDDGSGPYLVSMWVAPSSSSAGDRAAVSRGGRVVGPLAGADVNCCSKSRRSTSRRFVSTRS